MYDLALIREYAVCRFIWFSVQTKYQLEQPFKKYEHNKARCFPGEMGILLKVLWFHYKHLFNIY